MLHSYREGEEGRVTKQEGIERIITYSTSPNGHMEEAPEQTFCMKALT
jgi:hypothetical protein